MTDKNIASIELIWEGPYKFNDKDFNPLSQPGLYLWVVDSSFEEFQFTLSYIGESIDIRSRLHDEIIQLLGGGSWLWSVQNLRASRLGVGDYEPSTKKEGFKNFFTKFLPNLRSSIDCSIENLEEYSFFYTSGLKEFDLLDNRRSIETALIENAEIFGLNTGYKPNLNRMSCIQNARKFSGEKEGEYEVVNLVLKINSGDKIKGLSDQCSFKKKLVE